MNDIVRTSPPPPPPGFNIIPPPPAGFQPAPTPAPSPQDWRIEQTDRGRFLVSPQDQWRPIDDIVERALEIAGGDLARADDIADRAQRIDLGAGGGARGMAGSFLSGAPFVGSYADEALGAVASMLGRDRQQATESFRNQTAAFEAARPKTAIASQLAGGITGALGMAGAAGAAGAGRMASAAMSRAPAGLVGKTAAGLGAGAALGGVEGAVYGYGMGEGDERAQEAASQALFGAAAGGAVGAVAPAVGRGIKGIAGRLLNNPERAAANALGVSPGVARVARSLVGQEPLAAQNVARGGQGAVLADSGPAAQGMLDAALQTPGPGQQIGMQRIEGRAAQATGNINQALDRTMGAPEGRLTAQDAIRDQARPGVNQAYAQAYDTQIDYSSPSGRNIETLVNERIPSKTALRAISEANDRMRYEGMQSQIMASVDDAGNVVYQEMPNVMQLDYMKRAFDQIARDGTDPITQRMNAEAQLASRIARDLREATAEAVPGYRDALSQAADSIGQQSAVDFGATLLRAQVTPEIARRRLADMTEAELRAARQGVRSQIDDALNNVRAVASDQNIDARQASQAFRDLSSPSARTKLRALMGDEATELFRELDEAGTALGLRASVASNSRTAARQQGNVMIDQLSDINPLRRAASNPIRAYRETMDELMGIGPEAMSERSQAVRTELIDLLTRSGQGEAQRALAILQNANLGQPLAEAQARQVANAALTSLGLSGYQTTMQQTGR